MSGRETGSAGGLRAIRRPRDGPSAMLCSEGSQRSPRRIPETRTKAAISRSGARNMFVPDRPLPAANIRAMLSPRKSALVPKLFVFRNRCRTLHVKPLASDRVMCSVWRRRPANKVDHDCVSKKSLGTSFHAAPSSSVQGTVWRAWLRACRESSSKNLHRSAWRPRARTAEGAASLTHTA